MFGLSILSLIALSLNTGSYDVWQHLFETVLGGYVMSSLILMLGVGLGTFIIGVSAGWIITCYRFPFHKFFEILLLLPMAIPQLCHGIYLYGSVGVCR